MRALGIDFGLRKIGIALSDEDKRFGFPRSVVDNNSAAALTIQELVKNEGVDTIVIGASVNFAGADNPVMLHIRSFAKKIETLTGLPVLFEDETFSTQEAHRQNELHNVPRSRAEPPNMRLDSSAAAIILQKYLDRLHTTDS